MKIIHCKWDKGIDTLFLDFKEEKLYSYSEDYRILHQKFGGELYYLSQSGVSGAGWVESKPKLLVIGNYRPNADVSFLSTNKESQDVFPTYTPLVFRRELTFPIIIEAWKEQEFLSIYNIESLFRYLKKEKVETREIKIKF